MYGIGLCDVSFCVEDGFTYRTLGGTEITYLLYEINIISGPITTDLRREKPCDNSLDCFT